MQSPDFSLSAPLTRSTDAPSPTTSVIIKDIEMRFGSMIIFMIKWAFATIPAMIILAMVGLLISLFFFAFFASLGAGAGVMK